MNFAQTCEYWDGKISSVIGRYWSRKLNGHSVIWDGGVTRGLDCKDIPWANDKGEATGLWTLGRSNGAKICHAPNFWLDKLPVGVPIHGELWMNDDTEYLKTHCKRKSVRSVYWRPVKFVVFSIKPYCTFQSFFDLPKENRNLAEYWFVQNESQRVLLEHAKQKGIENNVVSFVEQTKINSKQQAMDLLLEFETTNWEGIMFNDLSARYENKRSKNILKFKPSFEDEAIITGYELGKEGTAREGKIGTILADYTITSKCKHICGYDPSFLGKTVQIRVSGLNQSEIEVDLVNDKFPIGSEIRFGFKMFSTHGNPQSCNIYRGM